MLDAGETLPELTLVDADEQTSGRGQRGNSWESEKGRNVQFSLVCHPHFLLASRQFALSEAIALAVAETVGGEVKWPNDIYVGDCKISGTLIECDLSGKQIETCIIGTGINVNIDADEFSPEIQDTATSLSILAGHAIDRRALLAAILREMESLYAAVQREGFAPVFDAWRELSVTLGQEVRVLGVNETFEGTAADIDETGALLVDTPEGRRRVLAGDVSIRPKGWTGKRTN